MWTPSPSSRPVVAVTGACSFLGENLVGLLEEDPAVERIVLLDRDAPPTAASKSVFVQTDLMEGASEQVMSEALASEGARVVCHLAFHSKPRHGREEAHELEALGTMRVLRAIRRSRAQKLVMRSHTLLYGAHPDNAAYLPEDAPLRASMRDRFFADKMAAEAEVLAFGRKSPQTAVTVLRMAPIVGPRVDNVVTRAFQPKRVPTLMGYDPLVQFLHELDAVRALHGAVTGPAVGTYNLVGQGVLRWSTVLRLAGKRSLPLPHPLVEAASGAMWALRLSSVPPSFLSYLRFWCLADGARAQAEPSLRPEHSTREAVMEFLEAQRLRDVELLRDQPAEANPS